MDVTHDTNRPQTAGEQSGVTAQTRVQQDALARAEQRNAGQPPAARYSVLHGFAHAGIFYSRENERDVERLPQDVRDDLLKRGRIVQTGAAQ